MSNWIWINNVLVNLNNITKVTHSDNCIMLYEGNQIVERFACKDDVELEEELGRINDIVRGRVKMY